jgi:hypothetical protein
MFGVIAIQSIQFRLQARTQYKSFVQPLFFKRMRVAYFLSNARFPLCFEGLG